jgi:hypothetical protein
VYNTQGTIPVRVRQGWARHYHIQVTNTRRWAKAHNVRVVILKLEVASAAGWITTWSGGSVPLVWQGSEYLGDIRNVGPPALADLAHVVQHPVNLNEIESLTLTPTFTPLGVQMRFTPSAQVRPTVQAQSDESDSRKLFVTIRCDATWEDGESEMAQHVRVEGIPEPRGYG